MPVAADLEALTLGGLELNDETTFGLMELSCPPPRQRQEWIGAADSEWQALSRNPLHENREVTAKIQVLPQASMDLALDKINLVVDKLQLASKTQAGVALTWRPADSTRTVTFDVLSGEITDMPIGWQDGWLAKAPTITVVMKAKPYWRGSEVLTSTASASAPFVTLEVTGVTGDVPALGRLIVTDTAIQSRRHVEWGIEGQHYNAATSLLIDSDDMVTSGFAGTQATFTGSYDPNASGNNVIQTVIYGSPQAICSTGPLAHIGTFLVKARVNNGSVPEGIYWRFAWRVGDGEYTTNAEVSTTIKHFVELDLGTITIPAVISGSQSWDGRVDAWKPGSSDTVRLDYLVLIPVAEGYGKARAVASNRPGVVTASDPFTGTTVGGNLNARAAPAGGTWVTSGVATDFTFSDVFGAAAGECVTRATTGDASPRFAILGTTNFVDTEVSVTIQNSILGGATSGVIARWVDSSNYLRGVVAGAKLSLVQVVAGVSTELAVGTADFLAGQTHQLRLTVFASGRAIVELLRGGSSVQKVEGTSTALATGGALDDGKAGLYDQSTTSPAISRYYDDFTIAIPPAEPIVIPSGRDLQVRHDDTIRQDSSGVYTGRPPSYRGSRFLVPTGTSRVLVKARRVDIETVADENVTDALQVGVGWTARGLAVPR